VFRRRLAVKDSGYAVCGTGTTGQSILGQRSGLLSDLGLSTAREISFLFKRNRRLAFNLSTLTENLKVRWEAGSLATQFAFAGFLVMLSGMMVLGLWLTQKIEHGVTRNTANSTASYTSESSIS
jgi:hypothetical protein